MKHTENTIYIRNVCFQKITEQAFQNMNVSNLKFVIILQSDAIDTSGNIYFFTSDGAFFMEKSDYNDVFIDKLVSITSDWNMINLYFCDFLIIKPTIYDYFVQELCSRNIRDFWFETAIDIYKKYQVNLKN